MYIKRRERDIFMSGEWKDDLEKKRHFKDITKMSVPIVISALLNLLFV